MQQFPDFLFKALWIGILIMIYGVIEQMLKAVFITHYWTFFN